MNAKATASILIVEDERIIAQDLQQTLLQLGYASCGVAADGEEALVMAREHRPDVVLMDIRIRGALDGIGTAERLRAEIDVPVVYLTAHADSATLARAKQTGPYGYLLKPVKPAELRSVLEVSIYKHSLEQRAREQDRWQLTILRSIVDAVVAVGPDGNVLYMNPAAETLTGTQQANALHRRSTEVLELTDLAGAPLARSPLELAIGTAGLPDPAEHLLRTAHGTIAIADSVSRVVDGDKTLGAVMVFRDVTEQRRIERRLRDSERLAALGAMAAGVAHEVSNPLAVVMTHAGLIEEDLQTPATGADAIDPARIDAARESLTDLQSAANRIGRIVQDLRDYSRPSVAAQGDGDVARAVEWAVRATSREFNYRARLVTEIAPLPHVAIDEVRLGQLLVNLLLNAAHAIAPGNVAHQEVRLTAKLAEQGDVLLAVQDTGCGIPDHELEGIFEPFHTSKPGVGMGLGLSISKGIVAAVGGSITVASRVGAGSTFTVRLPCAKQQPTSTTDADTGTARSSGRILVIDDEPLVLGAFRRALSDYDVECTESARVALDWLAAGRRFDLIVCDLVMPNMSGMEFHGSLLLLQPSDAARILFVTGGAITAEVREFLDAVPNPRLDKPCDAAKLRATVQQQLRRPDFAPAGAHSRPGIPPDPRDPAADGREGAR
jgi:PAS domain S-box-containing protein